VEAVEPLGGLAGGLGSPVWSLVLASVGLFYGLFGVARLRVYLDIPLIVGAAALLTLAIRQQRSAMYPPVRDGFLYLGREVLQVQSRQPCFAQVPHDRATCFRSASRARKILTPALFEEIPFASA
jgi:hypothetical protein